MKLPGISKETLYLLGAMVAAGVAFYIVKKLPAVGRALDPTNAENLANRAAVGIYQAVTGSTGTPGSDLAGKHIDERAARDKALGISELERGAELLIHDSAALQSCKLAVSRDYGGDVTRLKTDRCKKLMAPPPAVPVATTLAGALTPITADDDEPEAMRGF